MVPRETPKPRFQWLSCLLGCHRFEYSGLLYSADGHRVETKCLYCDVKDVGTELVKLNLKRGDK